jgi:hypothetical protein
MATVASRRVTAEREMLARQETANLMERAFALPWSDLNEHQVTGWQLSERCRTALRDPQLDASIDPLPGTPVGRRIRVELSWLDGGTPYRRRVRLTAWRFAQEAPES